MIRDIVEWIAGGPSNLCRSGTEILIAGRNGDMNDPPILNNIKERLVNRGCHRIKTLSYPLKNRIDQQYARLYSFRVSGQTMVIEQNPDSCPYRYEDPLILKSGSVECEINQAPDFTSKYFTVESQSNKLLVIKKLNNDIKYFKFHYCWHLGDEKKTAVSCENRFNWRIFLNNGGNLSGQHLLTIEVARPQESELQCSHGDSCFEGIPVFFDFRFF